MVGSAGPARVQPTTRRTVADFFFDPVRTVTVTEQVPVLRPLTVPLLAAEQMARDDFKTATVTREVFVAERLAHLRREVRDAVQFNDTLGAVSALGAVVCTTGAAAVGVAAAADCVIVARMVGVECVKPLANRRIQPSLSLTLVTTVFASAPVSMTSIVDLTGAEVNL